MLLYDGECSFCCRCASWVARRADIKMSPGTADDLENLNISVVDAKKSVWWIDGDVRLSGHRAVGEVLRSIGGGWRWLGTAMKIPPFSWIAAVIYKYVAANRHRITGLRD
ncbi:MAG: thiol-disulfide oxidoreductase DCC family protein [Candidatus Poriferisodalaceae bacterium]